MRAVAERLPGAAAHTQPPPPACLWPSAVLSRPSGPPPFSVLPLAPAVPRHLHAWHRPPPNQAPSASAGAPLPPHCALPRSRARRRGHRVPHDTRRAPGGGAATDCLGDWQGRFKVPFSPSPTGAKARPCVPPPRQRPSIIATARRGRLASAPRSGFPSPPPPPDPAGPPPRRRLLAGTPLKAPGRTFARIACLPCRNLCPFVPTPAMPVSPFTRGARRPRAPPAPLPRAPPPPPTA